MGVSADIAAPQFSASTLVMATSVQRTLTCLYSTSLSVISVTSQNLPLRFHATLGQATL